MDWFRRFCTTIRTTGSESALNRSLIEQSMRTVGRTARYRGEEGQVLGLASNGGLRIRVNGDERVVHRTEDIEVLKE